MAPTLNTNARRGVCVCCAWCGVARSEMKAARPSVRVMGRAARGRESYPHLICLVSNIYLPTFGKNLRPITPRNIISSY